MRSGVPGVPGIPEVQEVVDATGNVVQVEIPAVLPIPGIRATPIPAKCASRLLVASITYNYYQDTGRKANTNMMYYQSTLRDFNTEWTAIVTLSKESAPKVPTLSNTNTTFRWCESFKNMC